MVKILEFFREALNKLTPFMARQAHHERNQPLTVHPESVEGLNQSFLRYFLDKDTF